MCVSYEVTNMAAKTLKTRKDPTKPLDTLRPEIKHIQKSNAFELKSNQSHICFESTLTSKLRGKLHNDKKAMYAIAFDLDIAILEAAYHVASYTNAYADIRKRLIDNHGFSWQQGSVYFGGDNVNAVSCVLAVIDLRNTFPWFTSSVRDIRMLRIEEENDLRPALES